MLDKKKDFGDSKSVAFCIGVEQLLELRMMKVLGKLCITVCVGEYDSYGVLEEVCVAVPCRCFIGFYLLQSDVDL